MDNANMQDLAVEVLFDESVSFEPSLSSCCCCCTAATSEMSEETE
ncbi:Uncharacterised protein [Legionella londiniensis]|nr:Uncharacterised protein [Legionella londiniensis]